MRELIEFVARSLVDDPAAVQVHERQLHRVVVFVRGAVIGRVGRLKHPLIEMGGHAQAQAVVHRVDGAAAAFRFIEQRLPQ